METAMQREAAPAAIGLDLIWGVEAIAALIGRSDRQTFYLLSTGQLPAKKVGGRWVVERGKLVRFFADDAA